jgi:acetyl esterase/lipase
MLDVDSLNWFDYLVQQGFTVAAWTQPAGTFATAYPSAQAALTQFANDTAAMNSASPPPIVLIGHSRGGLLIHQLLRDPTMANLVSRIRWVITVHTPHHGSEVAETPQILAQETAGLFAALDLPADVVRALEGLAQQTLSPLNQLIYQNEKELAPNSQLIQGLLTNDTPVPGVKYYTFGGTSPMAVRLYTWLFTPGSALPQAKDLEVYFNWQANPAEVGPVSPLLNRVPPAMPEITPGQGDILVSDQSARLPYSIHQTDQLNHVEVLWNRALQQQVASILSAPLVPTLPQFPAKVSASGARPSR